MSDENPKPRAPFTKAAIKAIPARTITATSKVGIFGFYLHQKLTLAVPYYSSTNRLSVSELAHAVKQGKGPSSPSGLIALGLKATFRDYQGRSLYP